MSTWDERHAGEIARRNRSIDDGVSARNEAIDAGIAARNERLQPQPVRVQNALSSFFGEMDATSKAAPANTSKVRSASSLLAGAPDVSSNGGSAPTKVSSCPKAFAGLARKINELAQWFAGLTGGTGIKVVKSRGATMILIDPALLAELRAGISQAQATADAAALMADNAQTTANDAIGSASEALGYIASITEVEVGTCDPGGTINVLTR